MRIPYKINKNTFLAYETSLASIELVGELNRKLLTENLEWDKNHAPSLPTLALKAIKENFEKHVLLDELPCEDRDYLLEILDVELPLSLVVPLIEDEIYWQRRYTEKFAALILKKPKESSWKSLYIERHIQDLLEQAQPEYADEEEMGEVLALCAPFVKNLTVSQLLCWKPPLHWDEDDIPEFYPNDHINFEPVFKILTNIEELEIVYGMNSVSDDFHWNMFNLSVADCTHLGKALNYLKHLRKVKILSGNLEDKHAKALMQGFIKNESVQDLDLSHCQFGDDGALCIAKTLTVHPNLRKLNLCNNKIGTLGGEGLGFALLDENCKLEKLNLKLNPLKEGGTMGIYRALVRGTQVQDLNMAICQFEDDAPIRTGQMLILNKSLKKLDISNNWFDEEGGQALIDGLSSNTTLEWLDVRETDITQQQKSLINKYLMRNRLGFEDIQESVDEININEGLLPETVRTDAAGAVPKE